MSRKIFLNLPVQNLDKTREFFFRLGFSFNSDFCDDTAICMIVTEDIYAMFLTHDKFRQFTPNGQEPCDTSQRNEVLVCLSCADRAEVDRLVGAAVEAGGSTFSEPQDHGFMYAHSFKDLDGHVWELMHMDVGAIPPQDLTESVVSAQS